MSVLVILALSIICVFSAAACFILLPAARLFRKTPRRGSVGAHCFSAGCVLLSAGIVCVTVLMFTFPDPAEWLVCIHENFIYFVCIAAAAFAVALFPRLLPVVAVLYCMYACVFGMVLYARYGNGTYEVTVTGHEVLLDGTALRPWPDQELPAVSYIVVEEFRIPEKMLLPFFAGRYKPVAVCADRTYDSDKNIFYIMLPESDVYPRVYMLRVFSKKHVFSFVLHKVL